MTEHPITPPPNELVSEWEDKYHGHMPEWVLRHVAAEAARWGADQELEECCQHLRNHQWGFVGRPDGTKVHTAVDLRLARRPKPPSLKEQALQALDLLKVDASTHGLGFDSSAIRRALEALPDE